MTFVLVFSIGFLSLPRQGGFSVINVTDKPIETCADEVIRLIQRKAGHR